MEELCAQFSADAEMYSGRRGTKIVIDPYGVNDALTYTGIKLETTNFPVLQFAVVGNHLMLTITCVCLSHRNSLAVEKKKQFDVVIESRSAFEYYFHVNGQVITSIRDLSSHLLVPVLEIIKGN